MAICIVPWEFGMMSRNPQQSELYLGGGLGVPTDLMEYNMDMMENMLNFKECNMDLMEYMLYLMEDLHDGTPEKKYHRAYDCYCVIPHLRGVSTKI